MEVSFLMDCVVLIKNREMDSCKFKLSVIEAPESIELMVTDMVEGYYQKLLNSRLKPFLDQGVRVLTEGSYNNLIHEQFIRNQWVFKNPQYEGLI
jgi:hypothetical protein